LRANPPSLVFTGYPPFPALRAFLDERYLPSRSVPVTPDGRGLWVEKGRYGAFETSGSAERTGDPLIRGVADGELIANSERRHDLVPALADRVRAGAFGGLAPQRGVVDEADDGVGERRRRLSRLGQHPRLAGPDGVADA